MRFCRGIGGGYKKAAKQMDVSTKIGGFPPKWMVYFMVPTL